MPARFQPVKPGKTKTPSPSTFACPPAFRHFLLANFPPFAYLIGH
jgi:hypothetical protein